MPIQYVCRKCGKIHSIKEYEDSRFCKSCGSFLQTKFSKKLLANNSKKLVNHMLQSSEQQVSVDEPSKNRMALMRAVESLRQRVASRKEYSIKSESEPKNESSLVAESWIWNADYEKGLKLEKKLLKKYKGIKLEDTIAGKVVSNEQGECYEISETCTSTFKKTSYEESRRLIISDLKILYGIGPVWEQTLKKQGYTTIEKLEKHPIWKKQARNFISMIDTQEVGFIQNWLWKRLPKSHPLLHHLAGFCKDEDFAIIDIETLGLSERPIILLGIANPSKDRVCTKQYLLRDIQDEPSAIWSLVSQLESHHSMITYNGKSFDIPYIKQRLAYYGLDASLENPHFDLLHFTRRALRHKLKDCKLDTVESYLGIKRDIDIPGALVPQFYDTYLKTKNIGPLVAIVEHNKQDLVSLGTLFSRLYEEWNL